MILYTFELEPKMVFRGSALCFGFSAEGISGLCSFKLKKGCRFSASHYISIPVLTALSIQGEMNITKEVGTDITVTTLEKPISLAQDKKLDRP